MHNNSNMTSKCSSVDARGVRYRTDTGDTSLGSTTSGSPSLLSPADPSVRGIRFPWSPPVPAVVRAGSSPSSAAGPYEGHARPCSVVIPANAAAATAAGPSAASSTAPSLQDTPAGEAKRVPRPPNAWILYRSDCIQKMRAKMPEGARKPTQADLSKQFGEQWRNESEEVKTSYERLAEAAREEHAQKHPDWKFCRKQAKPNAGKAANVRKAAMPAAEPAPKRTRSGLYGMPGSRSSQKPHLYDMTTTLPPLPPAKLPQYYVDESSELPHSGQQIHYQDRHPPIPPQHQIQQQKQSQPNAVFPVQHIGQYSQQTQMQAARLQQETPRPLYAVRPMPVAQFFGAQYTFPMSQAPPPKQQQECAAHQRRMRQNTESRLYIGESLHDTLARRSSSAVELLNVYNRRQERGPVQSGLQTSVPEDGQSDIVQQEGGQAHFDSNSSESGHQRQLQQHQQTLHQNQTQVGQYLQDQAHHYPYPAPTFHTTTKVLPFDSQARSLPAFLPFGMPSSVSPELGFSPQQQQQQQQQVDGSSGPQSVPSACQQLDLSQFTWLQPHVVSPLGTQSTDSSAPGTALPDWLLPFGQVRVRQDDMIGMPLLDFLTEISASANAHAAEAYVQEPMLPSPTGLVAEIIEETTYSPPKESGGPSYSFP